MTEGEQQRNEEKAEILRLLGEWQERKASPIVRWAWTDENRKQREQKKKRREKAEMRKKQRPKG